MTTTPEDRDVHLWVVRLDDAAALRAASAHLAADEVARARRFASPEHGRRFTAARGALRAILGTCLDRPPGSLAFAYGPGGKPALAGADAGRLHFNLSHSHEVALVAVARDRALGVDVERVREVRTAAAIAARHFAPAERAAFLAATEDGRPRAFFDCWTRKEAYLKAVGEGIGAGLARVAIVRGARGGDVFRVERDGVALSRWSLRALEPMPGYLGALAVEGDDWSVVTRTLDP